MLFDRMGGLGMGKHTFREKGSSMDRLMDLEFYNHIKEILSPARSKVYHTANSAMVRAYWEIGKSIVEKQGGETKAEYGTKLLRELSK